MEAEQRTSEVLSAAASSDEQNFHESSQEQALDDLNCIKTIATTLAGLSRQPETEELKLRLQPESQAASPVDQVDLECGSSGSEVCVITNQPGRVDHEVNLKV